MKGITILIFVIILISCSNQESVQKKEVGNKIVESNFIEDSIFNGPTKYYNLDGRLESLIYYSRGIKNGIGLNFHHNGKVHDSSNYYNGLENGWHYVYDSTGQLTFRDYFFFGQRIGEEIHYRNGKPLEFSFSNLEKKKLYSCGYDSIGLVGFSGNILNVSSYSIYIDGVKRQGIFTYLIFPPTINIKYSLGLINEATNQKSELFQLNSFGFFKDTLLPLPKNGWKYYVAVDYEDTVNKSEKVFINVIEN
jgi:hypothetical protein